MNLEPECFICKTPIENPVICNRCGQPTTLKSPKTFQRLSETGAVIDVHSVCCNADVTMRQTCSGPCHELYVIMLVHEVGEYKTVCSEVTGKKYMVPTRDIIERGLRHSDLTRYPEVVDGNDIQVHPHP